MILRDAQGEVSVQIADRFRVKSGPGGCFTAELGVVCFDFTSRPLTVACRIHEGQLSLNGEILGPPYVIEDLSERLVAQCVRSYRKRAVVNDPSQEAAPSTAPPQP